MKAQAPFNPEMLTLARSYREFTQGDLAKAVGTAQGRISKIEHGFFPPPADLVTAFARVLELPESFFFQHGHMLSMPRRHHRKRAAIAKKTLDRVHAEITLRTLHIKELLLSADVESKYTVPEIDRDELGLSAEDVARVVREQWALPVGPIRNLVDILEQAGVIVIPCAFGVPEIDAVGLRAYGMPPMVFLNESAPACRKRWTLAHELGHLILHSLPREAEEDEANSFAAEFLMPEVEIKPQLRGVTLEKLAYLKRVWLVSMAALLKRARQLGVISQMTFVRILRVISANGWRRREPVELDLAPELPTLLAGLIAFHREQLGFGVGQLARVLHLLGGEVQRLYLPESRLRLVG